MNPTADSATEDEGAVEIRPLKDGDLATAMRLKESVHWNQTESDWRRLLELEPRGCFAACAGGHTVGTVTSVTYGTELAWIGMMLVDPAQQRRGVGTRLMRAALDYLRRLGVSTVKLDATPAGHKVYERLGFVAEQTVERWEGSAQTRPADDLSDLDGRTRHALYALDRLAFGADRTVLLESLMKAAAVAPLVEVSPGDGGLRGYALARRGSRAAYIGPLVAADAGAALRLLDGMLGRLAGEKVYLDFHTGSGVDREALARRGFVKQRTLARMRYGKESEAGGTRMVFAIAGPELG